MKKKGYLALVLCFILCFCLGTCVSAEGGQVVASFYPICIFAQNVIGDVPEIRLSCLASNQTGCLHDYQLVAGDMISLSKADLFLINGAGMESFLETLSQSFPDLPIVTCSEGIELIQNPVGSETEYNAHVWLDPSNAAVMVAHIRDALSGRFPEYAETFERNASEYIHRLMKLDTLLKEESASFVHRDIVTFHEAFPYFAKAYGLNVVAVISLEPDEGISPRMLSELVVKVREAGCPPLFTEPQYPSDAAAALAAETGSRIYELDPVVTGDFDPDSYEKSMLKNLAILKEALNAE